MSNPESKYWYWLFSAMYIAGLIGLLNEDTKIYFQAFTPLHLISVGGYVLWVNSTSTTRLSLLIVLLTGIIVEIIGVNTGILFGNYEYESTLGPEIFGVPFTIGINWMIMTFGAYAFIEKNNPHLHIIIKALMLGLVLILFDYIAEPVAIQYNMWHWHGDGIPPIYNYVCWFIISAIIGLYYSFKKTKINFSPTLFIWYCQVIFFIVLRIK